MELQYKFCKTSDGVRIAYATLGQGSPFVICPGWIRGHLNWEYPKGRAFLETIARSHEVIVYDRQGFGLSERKRTDFSLDSEIRTLQAVVDHLKLRRFILFGYSQGCIFSGAFAALYPRRLSHLILYAAYARLPVSAEFKSAFNLLIKSDWEMSSKFLVDVFIPDAEPSVRQWFSQNLREVYDSDLAMPFFDMNARLDATDLFPKVRVPTLVMHRKGDRNVPFHVGREVAAAIPGARFVQLEVNMHLLMLGDVEPIIRGIAEFLGDPIDIAPSKSEK